MIAIIDIDGTIADLSHRLHFIQSTPKEWDKFFDACGQDSMIPGMDRLIQALEEVYDVVYVTGRPDSHRRQTEDWLNRHGFPTMHSPYMRKAGDHRQDYLVKRELLDGVMRDFDVDIKAIKVAIEDRSQVVAMWRSLGILTLQPKDADY